MLSSFTERKQKSYLKKEATCTRRTASRKFYLKELGFAESNTTSSSSDQGNFLEMDTEE